MLFVFEIDMKSLFEKRGIWFCSRGGRKQPPLNSIQCFQTILVFNQVSLFGNYECNKEQQNSVIVAAASVTRVASRPRPASCWRLQLSPSAPPQRSECGLHYVFKEALQLRATACDWPLTDWKERGGASWLRCPAHELT